MISNHATVSCTLHQSLIFQKHARIDLIANVTSPSQLQTQRFDPLCYETKLYKIDPLERNINLASTLQMWVKKTVLLDSGGERES